MIALQIKKLYKITVKAITDTTIQSSINKEFLMQLKKCKKRKTQTDKQLVDYDKYLESEILEEHAAKYLEKV